MDIMKTLEHLRPGSSWTLDGLDYSGLTWLDDEQTKPTEEECETAWATLERSLATAEVRAARQAAYSELSDPMFFKWQRGTATEQDWLDSVASVREQYPYPA